jgi:hypothetical protein
MWLIHCPGFVEKRMGAPFAGLMISVIRSKLSLAGHDAHTRQETELHFGQCLDAMLCGVEHGRLQADEIAWQEEVQNLTAALGKHFEAERSATSLFLASRANCEHRTGENLALDATMSRIKMASM